MRLKWLTWENVDESDTTASHDRPDVSMTGRVVHGDAGRLKRRDFGVNTPLVNTRRVSDTLTAAEAARFQERLVEGDVVVSVNSCDLDGVTPEGLRAMLRGPSGTAPKPDTRNSEPETPCAKERAALLRYTAERDYTKPPNL